MDKKTTEEIIAAEIKKVMDRQAREEVDLDDIGSILKSEGETQRRLVDLLKQANAKKKSKEGGSLIANIKKNIEAEGVHLKKLEAALKDNESFQKRLSKDVAKSRTLVTQAEAAPDDLNQGTAKLSSKAHSVKVGAPQLDGIIQGYAQRMSDVVTGMRALGLPAKQFAAKTLVILNKIKKEINVDPGLTDEDRLTKRAKKICLIFVKQHTSNITKAGALGPLASLKKSLVKSAKQGLGNTIKRLPGMGVMDRLAERMDITPLSERINKRLGGKKGSLDQEFVREGAAGVSQVAAEDSAAGELGWESRSWGGQNSDTAQKMRLRSSAEAAVEVLEERVRELEAAADDDDEAGTSPRKVKRKKTPDRGVPLFRRKGDNRDFGALDTNTGSADMATPAPAGNTGSADMATPAPAGMGGGSDAYLEWFSFIGQNIQNLVNLAVADEKRDIAWAKERAEGRDDANERRLAAEGTTPIPAPDELSDSPIPASAGAGGGGGKGGGKGGGIGGIIGNFIGGVGGGVIAGFMKTVGSVNPVIAGKFILAITALGVGIGAFFVALAGSAKIIQMFGGGEAVQSLLTNAADGLMAFNTIDGLNLGKVGLGMAALAVGMTALTAGNLISGLGNFLGKVGGTIAGWFGADDEAEKEPSIIGFVKQFEAIDAKKLNESSRAMMRLATALLALSAAKRGYSGGGGAPSLPSGGEQQPARRRRGRQRAPAPAGEGGDAYAGLTIKGSSGGTQTGGGGQATGGGPVQPGVIDFASMIQENVQGFTRFTGFNDNHHQASNTSMHAKGLAMDFTVAGGAGEAPKAAATVRRLAADAGVPAGGMDVIDEYNHPSSGATGGHIHAEFNTEGAALAVAAGGLDESPMHVPPATGRRAGGRGAGRTGNPNAAVQSASPAGASRSGAGVAAATSALASTGAGTTNNVTIVGSPPAPAAPPVTNLVPFPMPTQPRNPDPVYNSLQSVGGNSNA
jgi:hypothetical protein